MEKARDDTCANTCDDGEPLRKARSQFLIHWRCYYLVRHSEGDRPGTVGKCYGISWGDDAWAMATGLVLRWGYWSMRIGGETFEQLREKRDVANWESPSHFRRQYDFLVANSRGGVRRDEVRKRRMDRRNSLH